MSGHSPPLLTTSSADGSLKTWDLRTGALVATHEGHSGPVHSVAWSFPASSSSPEAKGWVVGASDDGTARVFALQQQ